LKASSTYLAKHPSLVAGLSLCAGVTVLWSAFFVDICEKSNLFVQNSSPVVKNLTMGVNLLHCLLSSITIKSSRFSIDFREISQLGSAFIFLQ